MNQNEQDCQVLDKEIQKLTAMINAPQKKFKAFLYRFIPISAKKMNDMNIYLIKLTIGFLSLNKQMLEFAEQLNMLSEDEDDDEGGMYA